jgi:2'-5' RNA ligase
MRLFIAIDFHELRDYFASLQAKLPKEVKVKPVSSFHLTLKFLGKVPETEVSAIISKLNNVKFKPFFLNLGNMGFFPSDNFIRVVWVGVKQNSEIANLQQKIEAELEGMFKKERDFHPHITLARVKAVGDKAAFVEGIKKIEVDGSKCIEVSKFKLVKSTLTPLGPVYEDIECFKANNK